MVLDQRAQVQLIQAAESTVPRWGDLLDTISSERRMELRALADRQRAWAAQEKPDAAQSAFKDVRLSGADAFFLAAYYLAGPDGDLESQATRLRAGQQADVGNWVELSSLHLEGADLGGAHLQSATFIAAHLEGAGLNWAHLEGADLRTAHLEGVSLIAAHAEGATFRFAHLEGAYLGGAHLEGANLHQAHLEGATAIAAHLETATFSLADLQGADLHQAHFEGADLHQARLEGANLRGAHLEGANLHQAHFGGRMMKYGDPDLMRVRQSVGDYPAHLPAADLRGAYFDDATDLDGVSLGDAKWGYVSVADLHWRGANLAVIDWPAEMILGDERGARERKDSGGKPKDRSQRMSDYQAAVRANRQLAVALLAQGLNEEASRFGYNAQVLQQQVLRRQRKVGAYLFSRFLDALAGYGYKPQRSLLIYLVVIFGFALAYHLVGPLAGYTFQYDGALIFSVTSFHGRGFFPGGLDVENWITRLAALEAVIGLLIEISVIATFTQRFFGSK